MTSKEIRELLVTTIMLNAVLIYNFRRHLFNPYDPGERIIFGSGILGMNILWILGTLLAKLPRKKKTNLRAGLIVIGGCLLIIGILTLVGGEMVSSSLQENVRASAMLSFEEFQAGVPAREHQMALIKIFFTVGLCTLTGGLASLGLCKLIANKHDSESADFNDDQKS